jgi:hypothetical protein
MIVGTASESAEAEEVKASMESVEAGGLGLVAAACDVEEDSAESSTETLASPE